MKPDFLPLGPNRVWRSYRGGATLDRLEGRAEPADASFPEDWIGSTTRAINPGREDVVEGLARVDGDGQRISLASLIAADPAHYLGAAHAARFGAEPRVLVKLLDAAIRLHFQCHPTAEFAQTRLNSPFGKAEGYSILETRPDVAEPIIYLGFQRPPHRGALREMIENQDIAAIEACFDRIPVKPGDCLYVPGGRPHAIGAGVLMVEIMEPSDWAVRFEFERGGYTLPEAARFMQRGLDFALDVFDLRPWSVEAVRQEAFAQPQVIRAEANGREEALIDGRLTDRFRVHRHRFTGSWTLADETFCIGILVEGEAHLTSANQPPQDLGRYGRFLACGGGQPLMLHAEAQATLLTCHPPAVGQQP